MKMTDRDRKLLWGRAGSRCSYCRCQLVVDASDADRESIVGDEAHIVADSPTGPRANEGSRQNLDGYENAILLCKTHHKMIDDQASTYSVRDLQLMKVSHEQWVDQALSAADKAQAADMAQRAVDQLDLRAERRRYMARYGPSEWCPMPDSNGPEMTMRGVVALPAPVGLGPSNSCVTTSRLDVEQREAALEEALNRAPLTEHVRSQATMWGWAEERGWRTQGGSGGDELTRLALDVRWPHYRIRQPLSLAAAVLTGTTVPPDNGKAQVPGLVIALDMALNLVELDEQRRPSDTAYRSTPPPAPAALTLDEFAALLASLVSMRQLAMDLSASLLGRSLEGCWCGLWLQLNAVELERVVRLDGLDRLDHGLMVTRWMHVIDTSEETNTSEDAMVREFLHGLLKRSDYRRFGARVESASITRPNSS